MIKMVYLRNVQFIHFYLKLHYLQEFNSLEVVPTFYKHKILLKSCFFQINQVNKLTNRILLQIEHILSFSFGLGGAQSPVVDADTAWERCRCGAKHAGSRTLENENTVYGKRYQ